MAVIVPCAGRSSRFPGTRPKYLLTLYNGQLMVEKAVDPYVTTEDIHIVILKEHADHYDAFTALNLIYGDRPNVNIHIIEEVTSGPAETVYHVAKQLKPNEPILIQDCDSFFNGEVSSSNQVSVADLRKFKDVTNVAAKSYAVLNDQDMLTNIIEKSVSSNFICVGGYEFASASEYCINFEQLKEYAKGAEIFVSHIIKNMLHSTTFNIHQVDEFIDCGTYTEFVNYNQSKPTIFCDLDGTVFVNQSHYFKNNYSNKPVIIPAAVDYLLNKQLQGSRIIFTTSRPEEYKDITLETLRECGFENISVLFNMPHAPRMVINDNSKTNPYPTALAMNVPRDDNSYWEKIL